MKKQSTSFNRVSIIGVEVVFILWLFFSFFFHNTFYGNKIEKRATVSVRKHTDTVARRKNEKLQTVFWSR